MLEPVPVYVGYDPVEPVAYHVFCDSLIRNSTLPLRITPLALNNFKAFYEEKHTDGSNQFIYTRFLIPFLERWHGFALYFDGDMVLREGADIADLWGRRDLEKSVQVVKHPDYQTKHPVKYRGATNSSYPRKNWSSVILFNCNHFPNRILTPDYVRKAKGEYLHRFGWVHESQIGTLPDSWNRLVLEQEVKPFDRLLHYTIGTPCFAAYRDCDHADEWHKARDRAFSHEE